MYSRKDIEKMVNVLVTAEGLNHITDMLQGIQKYLYERLDSKTVRTSKFMELCADENWEYAAQIADNKNKQILESPLFKNFVYLVKNSPDYISIIRDKKIKSILK